LAGVGAEERATSRGGRARSPQREIGDEQLARQARDGSRDAFEELVRRHADRLYVVVLRFTGDPAQAEEVVQEAFLRAWRGIGSFQGRSQFFTWLYGIGLNEARRHVGRNQPAVLVRLEEGALEHTPDLREAPEPCAEQRDLRAALERAVRALPATHRAPLILRDVEGLSTEQAAEIMGLKEAAFKSRLHRARLAVRDAVRDHVGEGP
jgi:RNA polymerase sigma-70 factor (ECF subfamily)